MEIMEYLLVIITSYILGSFPTAYLVAKRTRNIDIREHGSGNVGAMNSYEVTESKLIGLTVFIIDGLKGAFAVFLASLLSPNNFSLLAVALIFAVIGHCFNIWLKFKGGRGLATAFGGAMVFAIPIALLWGLLWLIAYLYKKDIHFGNITATILTAILAFSSADLLNSYCRVSADYSLLFSISVSSLMTIIFIKHIDPLKEWFKKNSKRNNNETI